MTYDGIYAVLNKYEWFQVFYEFKEDLLECKAVETRRFLAPDWLIYIHLHTDPSVRTIW